MGWPQGRSLGWQLKLKPEWWERLEIRDWGLRKVVQAENGICKISEVQKTLQYRKINAFERWIGSRRCLPLLSHWFFLNFSLQIYIILDTVERILLKYTNVSWNVNPLFSKNFNMAEVQLDFGLKFVFPLTIQEVHLV